MSTCDGCKYADWKKTSNGRLHPDKGGKCTRLKEHPLDLRLPVAFDWIGRGAPSPGGGYITRGEEHMIWDNDKRVPIKCIFKTGM